MEKKRNLWVIPTDKPSSIGYDGVKNLHFVNDFIDDYQNIYITSDEEIISFNEINSLSLQDGKDIQTNMSNI